MLLFRFQHPGGGHLLPHERHREAEPRGPGRPQGQHAPLPERGDDHRHPEVSAIKRDSDLFCGMQIRCVSLFLHLFIFLFFDFISLFFLLKYNSMYVKNFKNVNK